MAMRARKDAWHQLTLAHFAGNPVYFFDSTFLLAHTVSRAEWSQARLQAAITRRIEKALSGADTHYATKRGSYIIFGKYNPFAARLTVTEICADILQRFCGREDCLPEDARRFCQPSSVQALMDDLDIAPLPRPKSPRRAREEIAAYANGLIEGDEEQFARELSYLYMEDVISRHSEGKYLFSPCWDSQQERIISFSCDLTLSHGDPSVEEAEPNGQSPAESLCRRDVAALAAASRGVLHLTSRGNPAPISMPIHADTLSCPKTRSSYFRVLSQIDPRYLAILVPRIVGLKAGADLYAVSLWIERLQRYVPYTYVHIGADLDCSDAPTMNATGFGLTVTASMRSPRTPDDALMDQAVKLERISMEQRAVSYAQDVASLTEFHLLKAHGFRLFSGPVVEPSSIAPCPLRALSLAQIEKRSLQAGRGRLHQDLDNNLRRKISENIVIPFAQDSANRNWCNPVRFNRD
jgi:hypothetical protein